MIKPVLLWCILVPAVTSIVILLPVWKPWRRAETTRDNDGASGRTPSTVPLGWTFVFAIVIGYAIAHLGLRNNWTIDFPPTDAKQWVLYFLVPVVAASLIFSSQITRWWLRVPIALALFGLYFPLLLRPMIANSWSASERWIWLVGLTIGATLFALSLDAISRRVGVKTWIFPVGLYTAITSGVLAILGSATTSLQAAVPAVFLGIAYLMLLWKRESRTFSFASLPVAFLFASFGCEIYFYAYAENPAPPLLLLAIAPSVMWLAFIPPVHRHLTNSPILRAIVLTLLIVLPSAAAGYLAYQSNYAQSSDNEYDPYAEYE